MFDIIEPQACSVEGFTMQIADDTRRLLSAMLPEPAQGKAEVPAAPNKEVLKAAREDGKQIFAAALLECSTVYESQVTEAVRHAERVIGIEKQAAENLRPHMRFVSTLNYAARMVHRGRKEADHLGYILEGVFNAAKAYMFQHGIKFDDENKRTLLVGMGSAPQNTAYTTDAINETLSPHGYNRGFLYYIRGMQATPFEDYGISDPHNQGILYSMEGVYSTEADVAMFHGFLGIENLAQLRWQNIRIAAAVKQVTNSDERARRAADTFRDINNFTYRLYPNDVAFGSVYADFDDEEKSIGIGSCMSGDSFSSAPYGVHPCDAYSAAHFGAGDNGLVLVVAYTGDIAVGRGILNVQNKGIVRWYGKHKALVQFRTLTDTDDESGALEGSWLALIAADGCFAHPYIDGDSEYGRIDRDTGRVILCDGEIDLQNTAGYSYMEETRMCCYDDEYYPESQMTYQEHTDTWIRDRNIPYAPRCAITGEHLHNYSLHEGIVDGEEVSIAEGIDPDDFGYQDLGGSIGWTANVDWYTHDDVTEMWYTDEEYADLIEAREEEEQNDEDSNANAA